MANGQYENPATFNDLLGGETSLVDYYATQKGIFANQPAATPKYRSNREKDDYYTALARLFIPFPNYATRQAYLNRLRRGGASANTLEYAESVSINARSKEPGYIEFLLQRATEQFQEKHQVVELLSDNYASFFFGAAAPMFTYDAILYNTRQDDWRAAFNLIYHSLIRGTQLARHKALVTLAYDHVAVTGVLVNMVQVLEASTESYAQVNFSILVKRYDFELMPGRKVADLGKLPDFIEPSMFSGLTLQTASSTLRDIKQPLSVTTVRANPAPAKDSSLVGPTEGGPETPADKQEENNVRGTVAPVKKRRVKRRLGPGAVVYEEY